GHADRDVLHSRRHLAHRHPEHWPNQAAARPDFRRPARLPHRGIGSVLDLEADLARANRYQEMRLMKTFVSCVVIAVACLAITGPAVAQAPAPAAAPAAPPVSPYKLTLDAGLVNAAGNTDVTTFNAGDRFEYKGRSAGFAQFVNAI